MIFVQILNTLQQILNNDSVHPVFGMIRHLKWQIIRALDLFPCALRISESHLIADSNTGVAALINCLGMYDYNNMNLVRSVLLERGGVFLDIGANIGSYTLVASEAPQAKVISIEPHPQTFAILKKNILLNKRSNIIALNIALSDYDGSLFMTNEAEAALNRIVSNPDDGSFAVPCRSADSLCRELSVKPNIIKIDVEDFELTVLHGLVQNLSMAGIILIENGTKKEIRTLLHAIGFVGPLYFHFNHMAFLKKSQKRIEDPIYLNPLFIRQTSKYYFEYEGKMAFAYPSGT
ncbi:MAG TPA: FkbM family methyltransferase [bacterium]|nr:FkbM family methyltransferase [bacterium]HQJ65915.1 FkbM family methyltransferase [bacterium]